MADFNQAIEWMKDGKIVRRNSKRDVPVYRMADGHYLEMSMSVDKFDRYRIPEVQIFIEDFESKDWEICGNDTTIKNIQMEVQAFQKHECKIPNRIRLHPEVISEIEDSLKIMGDTKIILGMRVIEDVSLKKEKCIVYYEDDFCLSNEMHILNSKTQFSFGTDRDLSIYTEEDVKKAVRRLKNFTWHSENGQINQYQVSDFFDLLDKTLGERLT